MDQKNQVTYNELRVQQYSYNYTKFPELKEWRKNPYTFLKAILYMECSAFLVLLLLKTKIKPNTITLLYILSGILGLILLSIPIKETIIISLVVFFLKGIFDWADGHLARITNQNSLGGHILDVYGAHVNEIGFYLGLGFFNSNYHGLPYMMYILPIYPLLISFNLFSFSKGVLFDKGYSTTQSIVNKNNALDDKKTKDGINAGKYNINGYRLQFMSSFLDSRARTVDMIALLILIEIYYPLRITWLIFIGLSIKHILIFARGLYLFVTDKWSETIVYKNN